MFKLPQFIRTCKEALFEPNPAEFVFAILTAAVHDPAGIEAELGCLDPSEEDAARYDFLHQSPEMTIVNVVMPGGLRSPLHNHPVWAAIGVYRGRATDLLYRREGNHIERYGHRDLIAPGVMVAEANTIHAISNSLAEPTRALHVYGGALANPARSLWNPFTLEEESFQFGALLNYERAMTEWRPHRNK